eukprot:14357994-Alexandrium_andersonii.AAC.1
MVPALPLLAPMHSPPAMSAPGPPLPWAALAAAPAPALPALPGSAPNAQYPGAPMQPQAWLQPLLAAPPT